MLTLAEEEAIHLLMEECAEVIHACTKILRHGLASHNPNTVTPDQTEPVMDNQTHLEKELGDLRFAKRVAHDLNLVHLVSVEDWAGEKAKSVQPYLHHIEVLKNGRVRAKSLHQ